MLIWAVLRPQLRRRHRTPTCSVSARGGVLNEGIPTRRGDTMSVSRLLCAIALLLSCAGAFAAANDGTLTRKKAKTPMTAIHAGMTMSEMGSGVVVFADNPQAGEG